MREPICRDRCQAFPSPHCRPCQLLNLIMNTWVQDKSCMRPRATKCRNSVSRAKKISCNIVARHSWKDMPWKLKTLVLIKKKGTRCLELTSIVRSNSHPTDTIEIIPIVIPQSLPFLYLRFVRKGSLVIDLRVADVLFTFIMDMLMRNGVHQRYLGEKAKGHISNMSLWQSLNVQKSNKDDPKHRYHTTVREDKSGTSKVCLSRRIWSPGSSTGGIGVIRSGWVYGGWQYCYHRVTGECRQTPTCGAFLSLHICSSFNFVSSAELVQT